MTRSTGRSRASTGRMSTRTTNSGGTPPGRRRAASRGVGADAPLGASSATRSERCEQDGRQAGARATREAPASPRRRCRRSCNRRWKRRKRRSPRRGARRSAARGLPARDQRPPASAKEQAEALYKLAELYWEESKEVYLEKMGRYQAAGPACHADRSECPQGAAPPADRSICRARRRSTGSSSTSTQVPQDRHGHLPLRLLAARPGKARRVD